jgi:hypothetical protein
MSPLLVCRTRPPDKKPRWSMGGDWPSSTLRRMPVAVFHTRTVLSQDAEATSCPSGENTTAPIPYERPPSTLRSRCQSFHLSDSIPTAFVI